MNVLRARDRAAASWKNGGGLTWEVARAPADSGLDRFDWRISCAEVATSGPFSTFAGVDRTILLLAGDGMVLTIDGVRHELERHRPLAFDGASATRCELIGGTTRDLNIMTARGRCEASVEVVTLDAVQPHTAGPGDPAVLLVLDGEAVMSAPDRSDLALGPLDAVAVVKPLRSATHRSGDARRCALRSIPEKRVGCRADEGRARRRTSDNRRCGQGRARGRDRHARAARPRRDAAQRRGRRSARGLERAGVRRIDRIRLARERPHRARTARGAAARADPVARRGHGRAGRARGRAGNDVPSGADARVGYSGARPVVAETMVAMLNAGITPVVPEHGSLGASGDLAPLAHCALALIGEGA